MTQQLAKPSSINNFARCAHHFPNRLRCLLLGFPNQPYCPKPTCEDPRNGVAMYTRLSNS